jgi:uncharacterized protein
VKEIKRSKKAKEYQIVQAVFYNRILGRLQGYRNPRVDLVLKDAEVSFLAEDYGKMCDRILEDWRGIRDGTRVPEPPGFDEAGSPWRLYTNRLLEERKDVTLFPGISGSARRKLAARLGVRVLDELGRLGPADFQKAFGPKSGLYTHLKYQAYRSGRPVFANGSTCDIPRRNRRFYFDFETCEEGHPSVPAHVYMIGSYSAERERFSVFVARGHAEEERIFEEFLAEVGDPVDACLYHWTDFEIGQMKGVIERHPKLREPISRLIASCVDLKECIAKKVFFGTGTYSIKEVAPFLGFRWRQGKEVGAYESMVLYWEWLEDQDPRKIEKVVTYNEDDCLAMVHVDKAVEQALHGRRQNGEPG